MVAQDNVTNLHPNTLRGVPTTSWLKFFSGEERDLWVQNISATQISMQFEIAQGQLAGVLLPVGADPICLTQEVPWDAIKKGMDFRKLLNRIPAVMKLLTEDEVEAYYKQKALRNQLFVQDPTTGAPIPNIEAAMQLAQKERTDKTARSSFGGDDTQISANGQVTFSPPNSARELMGLQMPPHMGISQQAAQAAGLQYVPQGMMTQPGQFGAPGTAQALQAAAMMGGQQIPQGFANAPGFIQQAQGQGNFPGAPGYGQPANAMPFNPQQVGFANSGDMPVMMDQVIHPRVLNLCQQVSMQMPQHLWMPAERLLSELQSLVAGLSMADLAYVESNGTYKTVKKWAKQIQAERVQQGQGDGIEDGLDHMIAGGPVDGGI